MSGWILGGKGGFLRDIARIIWIVKGLDDRLKRLEYLRPVDSSVRLNFIHNRRVNGG
jgi:hypothetical protein